MEGTLLNKGGTIKKSDSWGKEKIPATLPGKDSPNSHVLAEDKGNVEWVMEGESHKHNLQPRGQLDMKTEQLCLPL